MSTRPTIARLAAAGVGIDADTPPAPGVYRGVPFATYRAWDAVNKSTLDWLVTDCPAVCKHRMDNPEPETPAMLLGRALHTLVLEGHGRFFDEFVIAPECDRRTKDGKATWAAFTEKAGGRSILTEEQGRILDGMAAKVWEGETGAFLGHSIDNELSLVWRDAETGVPCKARLDLLRPGWNAIGDLKTCQSAHPERFARQIMDRGYARQAAFYLDGARALGLPVEHFALLPVEKEPPHVSALYVVDDDSIEIGREEMRSALRTFARCKKTGEWPGYQKPPGGFATCGLPEWAKRRKGGAA